MAQKTPAGVEAGDLGAAEEPGQAHVSGAASAAGGRPVRPIGRRAFQRISIPTQLQCGRTRPASRPARSRARGRRGAPRPPASARNAQLADRDLATRRLPALAVPARVRRPTLLQPPVGRVDVGDLLGRRRARRRPRSRRRGRRRRRRSARRPRRARPPRAPARCCRRCGRGGSARGRRSSPAAGSAPPRRARRRRAPRRASPPGRVRRRRRRRRRRSSTAMSARPRPHATCQACRHAARDDRPRTDGRQHGAPPRAGRPRVRRLRRRPGGGRRARRRGHGRRATRWTSSSSS